MESPAGPDTTVEECKKPVMPPNLLLKDKHITEEDKIDEISVTQHSFKDVKVEFNRGDPHNLDNLDNSHSSIIPYNGITKNTLTYLRSIPMMTDEDRHRQSGVSMTSYLQLDPDIDSELETPRDQNDPRENF